MTHLPALAFAHTLGPKSEPKIALVGEAWGQQEEMVKLPFMGASGQELTRMLEESGIARKDCFLTNTFAFRPKNNDIETLCGSKKDVGKEYTLAALRQGKYVQWEYLSELARLKEEIERANPMVVIALGAVACWALLGSPKITSLRGVVTESTLVPKIKVLPTYHPSAVLRNWALRPIVLADFMKAKRESEFRGIIRPTRQVLYDPTLAEVQEITQWLLRTKPRLLSIDIETRSKTITMVGFAWNKSTSMVVPFYDPRKPERSYWTTPEDELAAWECVRQLLESDMEKLYQNGMYDIQYLAGMGFSVKNAFHDTMLLHHSLYPEMQKSLGFLGSIYTNEASWKLMRTKGEELKRDE